MKCSVIAPIQSARVHAKRPIRRKTFIFTKPLAFALTVVLLGPSGYACAAATASGARVGTASPQNVANNSKAKNGTTKQHVNSTPTNLAAIKVTAIRQSLQDAQMIKRNSRMIVDAVSAEGIGKLPDNTVISALQRVPGVQISSNGLPVNQSQQGAPNQVFVRGLPNVATTINGRVMVSSDGQDGGRQFAFQDLPSTAVRTIKVYKTNEASLPAGGIAGVVDVELTKPFDFNGPKVAGQIKEVHSHYGSHTDPTASLLLSDVWNTGLGKFGALVNLGQRKTHYNFQQYWFGYPDIVTQGPFNDRMPVLTQSEDLIAAPTSVNDDDNIGVRRHSEMNYSLQWKIGNFQIGLQGLYIWHHRKVSTAYYFSVPFIIGGLSAPAPTGLNISQDCYTDQLVSGQYFSGPSLFGKKVCTATKATWTGNTYAATSTQADRDWGHTYQDVFSVKWHNRKNKLMFDVAKNGSSYYSNRLIIDTFLGVPITTVYDDSEPDQPRWKLAGNPAGDVNNFYFNGLIQNWKDRKHSSWAYRLRGETNIEVGPVAYVDYGVAYRSEAANASGSTVTSTPPPGGAFGSSPADPTRTNRVVDVIGAQYMCPEPTNPALHFPWLTGCYDYMESHKPELRNFYGLPPDKGAPVDPADFYHITEKRDIAYLQVGYDFNLMGVPVTGLIGIRGQHLDRSMHAFNINAATGGITPLTPRVTENNYMPSFSALLHFTPDIQGRLAYSKTISYPSFAALDPARTLIPANINRAGNGTEGNPNLTPIVSHNYDIGAGWYFAKLGSLTADVFYRKIKGYIQTFTTRQIINGVSGGSASGSGSTISNNVFFISSPESSGSGTLKGIELAYQQAFTSLPGAWSGLGVQANYTLIKGQTHSPTGVGTQTVKTNFQNVSENNYNIVLFYQKYGFSARIAYNYRSSYLLGFTQPTIQGILNVMHPPHMVDASVQYAFNKHLVGVIGATNIFGAKARSYYGDVKIRPDAIQFFDTTIDAGLRFSF